MLVPGLDRLDGTCLAGMPDDLWVLHTAELRARFDAIVAAAESDPTASCPNFTTFCAPFADGTLVTAALKTWLTSLTALARE